jgi:hypothetical protein
MNIVESLILMSFRVTSILLPSSTTIDDVINLFLVWPSDEELQQVSTLALSEASDLLAVLGIDATAIIETSSDRTLNRRAFASVPGTRIKHVVFTETTDNSDSLPTETLLETLFRSMRLNLSFGASEENCVDAYALALVAEGVDATYNMCILSDCFIIHCIDILLQRGTSRLPR